jgi:hypothetical protein
MNTRMILASIITATTLAACSSPTVLNLEDVGAQPTLAELNADNDAGLELAGKPAGLGNLLVRKIYDVNQNGKRDEEEPGIPDWGVRIVSVDGNGNPDDAADIQVTPQGSQRWRGVSLKVPYGKYKIEELEPTGTKQAGTTWKVTGQASKIVNVSREKSVRAVEFAGVCLENGAVVKFPKVADFGAWKCRATFDLLPRIGSFTATPDQIQSSGSSALAWNVLDYSKLEITPTVGVITGFTGSRNVTPASTTAYTLKATNGFGSRTASVSVNVGANTSGKWSTVGDLKFATGELNQILALGSDRFIIGNGAGKNELYDFKTGSSKELLNLIAPVSAYYRVARPSDQKVVTFFSNTTETLLNIYDPNSDTSSTVNTQSAGFSGSPAPAGIVPLGAYVEDFFMTQSIVPASTALKVGLLNLSTFKYGSLDEVNFLFDPPGTPVATGFAGLTKDKKGLFIGVQFSPSGAPEARALIANPRSGAFTGNLKLSDPSCFFLSSNASRTVSTFGPTVTLSNGNFLRVGGTDFKGGAVNTFCEYDPVTNTIIKQGTSNQLSQGTPFLLGNGQVLAMRNSAQASSSNNAFDADFQADLYNPNSKTFTLTSPFVQGRRYSKAAQLSDGRVLLFGGVKPRSPLESSTTPAVPLSSIEVYTP